MPIFVRCLGTRNSSQYTCGFRGEAIGIMNGGLRALGIALGMWVAGAPVCAQVHQVQHSPKPAQTKPLIAPDSEWARGNRILLGVTQARIGFSARWRFERAANGDILLEKDESRAGQAIAGALLLVGNGALAVKDGHVERGRELDSIDGPLVMLQLVLRLLERAAPSGPRGLSRDSRIDVAETASAIKVSGVGTEVEFFAPWRVTGTVGPGGPGQAKFELEFRSASRAKGGQPAEISIAGIWQNVSPPVALPDTMALRGWRVYQLKPAVRARGAGNAMGVGVSAPMSFSDLGQLRRSVVAWAAERERRARWQCS
jgi:hypothetical protein